MHEATLAAAGAQHQAGKFAQAEALYRKVLASEPNHAHAMHLLGAVLFETGRQSEAFDLIHKSIRIAPSRPDYYANLGIMLLQIGQAEQSIPVLRHGLKLHPNLPQALNGLGVALQQMLKLDEAAECLNLAIAKMPDYAEAHNNLGSVLMDAGKTDAAIAALSNAVRLRPDMAKAHSNLSQALRDRGRLSESLAAAQRAAQLQPRDFLNRLRLGNTLQDLGRAAEAVTEFERALNLYPGSAAAGYNLANALHESGRTDESIAQYQRIISARPDFVAAHNNLGFAYKDSGEMTKSLQCIDRAIALAPANAALLSARLYATEFYADATAADRLREGRRFDLEFGIPLEYQMRPHLNVPEPERRLRVGYVSPDFRRHAESFFTVPLLEHHDHERFEIFGYYGMQESDEITARIRACTDRWQTTESLTDGRLADLIRNDRIDILIDLTMHMAHNRMLVFARKPSPVQITWLAYPGTTGLSTMDYRLTDSYLDEPGCDESVYVERSIRLPDYWLCYDSLSSVAAAPSREAGPIRFGSLNNPCKLNEQTLELWCRLMREVADSRLIVSILAERHGKRIASMVNSHGIDPGRIEFVGRLGRDDYLRQYHRIDIALDPLPYNGITTTCDALWMGVPVVTLMGNSAAGRASMGILANLKLPQWVAGDADEFVSIARELAGDLPGLAEWRKTLRSRMESSPVMDAKRFTKNVEIVYRDVWRKWCADPD